jgi:hypothetical protein
VSGQRSTSYFGGAGDSTPVADRDPLQRRSRDGWSASLGVTSTATATRTFISGRSKQKRFYEGRPSLLWRGGAVSTATPDVTYRRVHGSLRRWRLRSLGGRRERGRLRRSDRWARLDQGAAAAAGRLYVVLGWAARRVPGPCSRGPGFFDQLGRCWAARGDVNGDGHPDLFASRPTTTPLRSRRYGAIHVGGEGRGARCTPTHPAGRGSTQTHEKRPRRATSTPTEFSVRYLGLRGTTMFRWFGGRLERRSDLTLARRIASVAEPAHGG